MKKHLPDTSLRGQTLRRACILLLLGSISFGCGGKSPTVHQETGAQTPRLPEESSIPSRGRPGGELAVAWRAEPRTFNPALALGNPSRTVAGMLNDTLVRLDRVTYEARPALAESWTVSPDGRRFVLELRRDVRFSDGQPFDADDVVFSFQVHLDEETGSVYRGNLIIGGRPIQVRKTGTHSIEIELAEPDAEGVKLVDSVPILARHRLEAVYRESGFPEALALATPSEDVVGLGPFRLRRYTAGERLELERNPYYWRADAQGQRLPYLERLTIHFVANEAARVLRFTAGETHVISRLGGSAFNQLVDANRSDLLLRDLGPGLDFHFLFFNLNDLGADRHPELERKQVWFRERSFRRAVSLAIDRRAIARLAFDRRATPIRSHIAAGNKRWVHAGLEAPRHAPQEARRLLAEAGFTWDAEARLIAPNGRRVSFSIAINTGNQERAGIAAVIQEDLRRIGIEVALTTLEFGALMHRLTESFEYEASILSLRGGVDPNSYVSQWHSEGGYHLWRLTPSAADSPWQRELDRLLDEQRSQLDYATRKKTYDRVQTILAEQEPFILLVSPNVLVGARADLGNFSPSIIDHVTLWNVDELYWQESGIADRN